MDVVAAGDLRARFLALVAPFDRLALLLRGELRLASKLHTASLGAFAAFASAGADRSVYRMLAEAAATI